MKAIHHHLCKKFRVYHRWHKHPKHAHVHWGLLGAVVLGVALSFVMLGWIESNFSLVDVVRAQAGGKIAVLVSNSSLRDSLQSSLATYQNDLQNEGYTVEILTGPWSTPQAVRSLLQLRRAGLTGAVLVGNIPALKFNDVPSQQGDPYFYDYPADMYYMDLDGSWSDADSNGTYETWDGSLPEIWVSRLKADNLGLLGNEVSILQSYFNKNHQFRTGGLSVSRRALVVYHNIDIVRSQAEYNGWGTSPSLLYGDVTIDGPSIENLSEDPNSEVVRHARQRWIDGLRDQSGYELMVLNTATLATRHTFGSAFSSETGGNNLTSADIDALQPKRAIWYHFLTSNPGQYQAANYIGGIYLFDSPTTMAVYAGTQHSGVVGYKPLYEALAQNQSFGEALQYDASYELRNLGRTYTEYVSWTPDHRDTWDISKKIAATVLLGDGTLRLKTTSSSPPPCSTATLDFSGTAVGTTRSCTTSLNLSGASSATLSYTAEDIDEAGEATWRVNSSQSQNVPATGDAQVRQFSTQVLLSSLTSGTNTVSFTFASNLGGTTSGFRITNVSLTVSTTAPDTTSPTISSFDIQPRQGQGPFTLSWTVSDSGSGVASIEPWRSDTSCAAATPSTWRQLTTLSPSSTSYQDNPSSSGTYCYGIHVKDAAGNETNEAAQGKGPLEVIKQGGGVQIEQWQMRELSFTASNTYSNPFRDVAVTAVFTSPSNQTLSIPGFFDGSNQWKVRYILAEIGVWRWQVTASPNDAGLSGTGTITVVGSSRKGFIRVHRTDPHHFQYSNGESFFYMGDTSYNLVTLDRGSQRLPYLQRRSSQGFSHLRFIIGNVTSQGWPWGGTPTSPDRARLNLSYFQKVDQTMEDLASYGMGAEIIMLNYYDASTFAWTRSQEDFFLSYLLARYGAFTNLVQWTLVNEHELYPDGSYGTITSEDIAWIRDRAAFIRARDPFKHFLTTHPDTSDAQMGTLFGSDSNLTIIQHQTNGSDKQRVNNCYYRWEGEGLEDFVAGDRSYNKPVVVGEFGYEYNGSTCQGVNSDTDTLRKSAWRFRMGGAYFSAGFRSTVYNFPEITFDVDNNGGRAQWQMQYLADIFKSLPYTEMSPSFQLVNSPNLALAKLNEAYLVYAPQGGTVSLNLSSASGSFSATWHNPRTGAMQGLSTVSGGASRTFNAPDNQDWVLVVQKGSGNQEPPSCSGATLDFSGTAVGTTRSCTTSLNLSGASSGTLSYTAEDIDEAGEATWRVNSSQPQNVPATGDAQVRQFSTQVPLSSLTSGTNTVSFTFASNLGGTTSGFRITNVSLTVSTTAADTTLPTVISLSASGVPRPTVSWSVSDAGGSGLSFVQVWRANRGSYSSCSLVPGADFQHMPQGNPQNLNPGAGGTGSWQEPSNLSASAYCYGLHVNDQAGNYATESPAQRQQVIVAAANQPPSPPTIAGPTSGNTTQTLSYTFTSTDPENGDIEYLIEWESGVQSSWSQPLESGTSHSDSHRWTTTGPKCLRAQARDPVTQATSTWSGCFNVMISVPAAALDTTPPTISAFNVQPRSGPGPFTVSWTASDNPGGSGLKEIQVWRSDTTCAVATAESPTWQKLSTLPGTATSHQDNPSSSGSYCYGLHAVDNTGLEQDERQAGKGPLEVVKTSTTLPPPTSSLISSYPFDDGSGTSLTDSVGGHHGTLVNMENADWVEGKTGGALQFDGVNEYVTIPHSPDFELASGKISFWFKLNSLNDQTLLSKDHLGFTEGGHLTIAYGSFCGTPPYPNALVARLQSLSQSYCIFSNQATTLQQGQWYQAEFWFGDGGMRMAINGVMQQDTDPYTGGIETNHEPIILGAGNWFNPTTPLLGHAAAALDELRIERLAPADGGGGGGGGDQSCTQVGTNEFTACFYNNQTLSGNPVVTRTDNQINFNWGLNAPAPGVNAENFSLRSQGNFTFEAGEYDFTVTTDDGVRLYVDNSLIIDKWVDQDSVTHTATRTLTQGPHLIRMEFYDNTEHAVAKLSWQKKTPPQCQTTTWQNQDCGQGGCSSTQRYQTRTEGCGGATSQCVADTSCTPAPQKGSPDLNGDGTVGIADLSILVRDWGRTDVSPSDINQDGIVNVKDLGILFHFWGKQRGSCGYEGNSCSVGSCPGSCDLSGNTCVKSDPACGGGTAPQCSDSRDNDGDQKIDFGTGTNNDPGCSSSQDDDETDPSSACVPFQTLTVDSMNAQGISTARPTAAGKTYRLTASGTYNYWTSNTDTLADAEYADTTRVPGYPQGWNDTTDGGLELQVNNQDIQWMSSSHPQYNPTHTYTAELLGTNQSFSFKILDNYYLDNQGSLSVRIEECGTGGSGNLCGNPPGRIDPGEQCDGTNLNSQTCQTLGFQSGTTACYPPSSPLACQLDTSGCTNPPTQVCTPNQACPYTSQNCAGICNAQGTMCSDANANDGCPAPVSSDSYPLIGWQTFGAGVDDFNARFDLFVSRVSDTRQVSSMKSKNPNLKVMYTEDWNAGCGISNPPPEWLLYTSNRQQIPIYDSGQGNGMRNLSKFAPRATAGEYAGKTYFEVCSDRMTNVDWGAFYGVFTDGLWGKDQMVFENKYGFFFQWPDIDMDGNLINDHDEIGPGRKWSSNQAWADDWQVGVDTLLRLLREKLNARAPGRPITLNVGSPFSWGRQWVNGFVVEKYSLRYGINVTDSYAQNFQAQAQKPFTSFALGLVDPEDPERNANPLREARDHLRAMRFGLTTAMFDDFYFSFQDPDEGNPHSPGASQEHYWSFWYDEFESDLGKPIDTARTLKPGLGYRCFEKGIALANVDGASKTVTANDLSGLCGYSGVYYRLKSGQDLALKSLDVNWTVLHDGSPLTSVTLNGVVYQKCYGGCLTIYRGDGLLLFRQPTTVVSDIIIDNNYMSTSPTQQLMQYSGFTQEGNCSAATNYYAVRCAWNPESWAYAYAQPGSATATFRPSIGIAGNYEVFEWHGRLSSGSLASNVTHTINYTGGSTNRTVNQQQNAGQWNSLGIYRFNAGTGGYVTLSAQGANGTVMADAVMFRYIGP